MTQLCTGCGRSKRRWRPVDGFPDYEVSDHGDLRLSRFVKGAHGPARETPATHLNEDGYVETHAYSADGIRKTIRVHRLVLLAFVGPPPFEGAVSRHKNHIRNDNHASNLEYGTTQENTADSVLANRHAHRLTPENVIAIRKARTEDGATHVALAERFGVGKSTIGAVLAGHSWRHIR